ncbi:signal peptidase I [Bacillus sp. 31A1R]|uniref:Signal peptidase I n=1 Tax=Robertmurraya mangrovi TaxID=3098077 RepID=A0ABU5J1W1_9BACI|nr:signal peptidase I [Bacillus sp. 31A1R]MDZ5473332.1 signal peptidase I [Bacillus sp. 31A1R]
MENTAINETNIEVKDTTKKSSIMEWVKFILMLALVVIVIRNSIGFTKISGLSMFPTFQDGDFILEEKISKYFSSPETGDVVIINKPEQGYKIIKRVIALGGDTVMIKDGTVFVNDQPLPEIMTSGQSSDMEATKVPADHIFVIGDNRTPGESIDSRDPSVGPIPHSDIDGYVLFSLIPFKSIPKPIEIE